MTNLLKKKKIRMLFRKSQDIKPGNWKKKARMRSHLLKKLSKKVQRLIKSRGKWKDKAKRYKEQFEQAEQKIKTLEDELKKNDM